MAGHITQDQADEYAIGSLDPGGAALVEAHVASCPACAAILSESERASAALILGIPRKSPPSSLRRRVMRSAGIARPGPLTIAVRLVTAGAGIAAVVLAVAALTGMFSLRDQVRDLRQTNSELRTRIDDALSQKVEIAALTQGLSREERRSAQFHLDAQRDRDLLIALLSPEADVADVYPVTEGSGAIGRLVWDESQKKVWFVASHLETLPPGQTYQVWVNSAGRYVSLGTFSPDASGFARYETLVPQGLKTYESAVVTVERAPGSVERSGPSVFASDLSRLRR